ncbi:MAG: HU family DNA-binding protein [Alloprevotella sp.]
MTKQDIIRQLEERTNLSLSQSTHAVEGIIEIIAEALSKDEAILLRGFGTIKTVQRAAKPARNISKGTTIMLPPTKQVKFIAYNSLKQRVNHHGRYLK